MTKSNSRLRQQCSKLSNIVFGVLSLAPCYVRKKQVRAVDQTAYPLQTSVASLATDWWMEPWPPANRVKFNKKFYICSDVTHTHLAYSEAWFWKSFAGGVGNTPVRMNLPGASIQVVLISLRREILFHLKYLDRVVEAHAINHPPSFVDFPRCRSSRQSVWKLFG